MPSSCLQSFANLCPSSEMPRDPCYGTWQTRNSLGTSCTTWRQVTTQLNTRLTYHNTTPMYTGREEVCIRQPGGLHNGRHPSNQVLRDERPRGPTDHLPDVVVPLRPEAIGGSPRHADLAEPVAAVEMAALEGGHQRRVGTEGGV